MFGYIFCSSRENPEQISFCLLFFSVVVEAAQREQATIAAASAKLEYATWGSQCWHTPSRSCRVCQVRRQWKGCVLEWTGLFSRSGKNFRTNSATTGSSRLV